MIIIILRGLIKISKKVRLAQFLQGVSCIRNLKGIKDQIGFRERKQDLRI